ncbi:hypothetical protein BPOR_1684g00010 [Botrytis porri]|uniref:Uncharacterized protein n=1 Tax=Botrytis porri TaxID=87229 RepID=A0A4Z1K3Z2_9HELO|nr:hypothetical protein BPOR_1684g00010 [Botrytis porri]
MQFLDAAALWKRSYSGSFLLDAGDPYYSYEQFRQISKTKEFNPHDTLDFEMPINCEVHRQIRHSIIS